MSHSITAQIEEAAGVPRRCYPVTHGCPFARGALQDPQRVRLTDGGGKELPLQTTTLATWPDGSIKWLLLDTQAFLWRVFDDPRLSPTARELIAETTAEILFSAISAREIAINAHTGRLDLPPDVAGFVTDRVRRNRFRVLPIDLPHALHAHELPDNHRDPFDRLLVAQAQVEAVPLLSRDTQLAADKVELRW